MYVNIPYMDPMGLVSMNQSCLQVLFKQENRHPAQNRNGANNRVHWHTSNNLQQSIALSYWVPILQGGPKKNQHLHRGRRWWCSPICLGSWRVEQVIVPIIWAMKKNPGCLGCIGDYTTQYMGILISQYKDPFKPTRIMESRRVFS